MRQKDGLQKLITRYKAGKRLGIEDVTTDSSIDTEVDSNDSDGSFSTNEEDDDLEDHIME